MEEKNIYEFLKEKSISSFLLAIEIFNKPTIQYRLEGCIFSLCNAWELLLKAKMLKDNKNIYYPEKMDRTLSLQDCLKEVFVNENDPIRQNLKVIISLRNTSTHFIIPEYEFSYMPFLAFCVKAFADKLYDFLGVNITDYIKTDFLTLFANNSIPNNNELLSKYGKNIIDLFEKKNLELQSYYNCEDGNAIAYKVNVNLVRISNQSHADFTYYISNKSTDPNAKYINRYTDLNETHTFTFHGITNEIDKIIKREKIPFSPIKDPIKTKKNPNPNIFTTACLDVLLKAHKLKENRKYVAKINVGKSYINKYSKDTITYIISLILDDKDIVLKCKKRLTPGA